jgi:hypothetical protein
VEGFPGGQAATAAVTWIGSEVQECRKRWRCATEVVLDSTWSHRSLGASLPRNAELVQQVGKAKAPHRPGGNLTSGALDDAGPHAGRVSGREYVDDYGVGLS